MLQSRDEDDDFRRTHEDDGILLNPYATGASNISRDSISNVISSTGDNTP